MKPSHRAERSENTFYSEDVCTGEIYVELMTCVQVNANEFVDISWNYLKSTEFEVSGMCNSCY